MTPSDRQRILVVEDSETQALRLRYILEKEDLEVEIAVSGEQALEMLNKRLPHVMLVDYYLPGMRGDELCRQVQRNIQTRGIPILMQTIEETDEAELRGLESGADDYVPKSADPDVLLLKIRTLLRKAGSRVAVQRLDGDFRRARLLAIDDSPTYLEFLRGQLEQEGYSVDGASNGEEGMAKIAASTYDCILVDLVMPNIDGIEIAKRINILRQAMASPLLVLMLTARETKEDLTRALEAGADDFVGKSSDMAVIKGRIRALLRRKFFQEENRRIHEELKAKELETIKARVEKEAAEARAVMAEERQRFAVELQRSNEELEQFAYVVSHDLKAPLRGIITLTEWLTKDYSDKLDQAGKENLALLTGRAKRMHNLIDGILQYSRVSMVRQTPQEADVQELVRQSIDLVGPPEHTYVVVEGKLPHVTCETTKMMQLFQNLISNAVKYMDKPKGIVRIACEAAGDMWRFSVADNGPGIDQKYFEKIFQIFQTLAPRDKYESTGVGLAVVKKIVERWGGKTWVESRLGEGSTFFFTIPQTAPKVPVAP